MNDAQLLHPTFNGLQVPIDVPILKNHGVKLGQRPTDFIAGGDFSLPYEVVNPTADWRNNLVRGEKQWFPKFDSMGCTAFSNNNSAEIQINFITGVELNFSDLAMNLLAEGTQDGNWLYKPADVGRNIGRILEDAWPTDNDATTWKSWMKPLSDEAKRGIIRFNESYEWVGTDRASLAYHLKHAPILIVIGANGFYHVVVLVAIDNQGLWYFDSYDPWLKVTTQQPSSALKLIIKPQPTSMVYKKQGEATLYFGVGTVLIPFATDYPSFLKEFATTPVIELSLAEFSKLKVASELKVKK